MKNLLVNSSLFVMVLMRVTVCSAHSDHSDLLTKRSKFSDCFLSGGKGHAVVGLSLLSVLARQKEYCSSTIAKYPTGRGISVGIL
jgi:hypothetical protein